MRGRRCAKRSRGGSETIRLRGACAVSLVSSRPGGVGAPPGDTTIPRQELAHVGRGVLRRTDARPGMGRYRSPAEKEATPRSAKSAARQPMTRLRLSDGQSTRRTREDRRDGASEGAACLPRHVYSPKMLRRPALRLPSRLLGGEKEIRRGPRATTSGRRAVRQLKTGFRDRHLMLYRRERSRSSAG